MPDNDLDDQIAALDAGLTPEKRITKGDRTVENHDLAAIDQASARKRLERAAREGKSRPRQLRAIAGSGC